MRDMEIKNKRTVTRRVEERDNGRNKGNMYKGPVDKDNSLWEQGWYGAGESNARSGGMGTILTEQE